MTTTDYTLTSITALKSSWLADGAALFDRLSRVAREMGDLVEVHNREYLTLTTSDVTVQLVEHSGPWNPYTGGYYKICRLYVSVGRLLNGSEKQTLTKLRETIVAYMDKSTIAPEKDGINPDALFMRKGKWIDKVLALEPLALERERVRAITTEAEERDRIYFQLQLDKEV